MRQYLQLFKYLKEFAKLRNQVIKNIDSSKQYDCVWLDTIPNNSIFFNTVKADSKEDFWLKLKKPKEPKAPIKSQIQTPEELINWLENLHGENIDIVVKTEIEHNEVTLFLDDKPELKEKLSNYIKNQWLDDLLQYQEKYQQYQKQKEEHDKQLTEYTKLFKLYQQFFKFYEELKNNSETHELVIAVGLFNYQQNNDTTKYCRHLITQTANIEYNKATIIVKTSGENLEVEDEFILTEFDSNSIQEAKKNFEQAVVDEQNDDIDLLDIKSANKVVKIFADGVGIEQYYDQIFKPKITNHKSVFYALALNLRKKNTSKLSKAYAEVIKTLENQELPKNIKLIDYLLGQNMQDNENRTSSKTTTETETIYFPHPANQEQEKILDKIKHHDALVVQGPPGTGKSHTIANLICHLLATSNKVLVTAQTKRALEVLKDKLPDEYKSLVVNYWGSDQASKDDLSSSVEAIKNKSENFNYIDKTNELDQVKRNIAKDTNKYKEIVRQGTQEINNPKYQGMLVDVLEQLKTDEQQFEWYQDKYKDYDDSNLENQFNEFIKFNETYPSLYFDNVINIEKLPTPDELKQYHQLIEKCGDLSLVEYDIQELKFLINQLPALAVLKELDNITITYPDKDLNILKNHAKVLLKHLTDGNKLQGIGFSVRKHFLSKEIKEKLYFVEGVKVNDSDCDTIEEFEQVIKDVELKQRFDKLKRIYNADFENEYEKKMFYQEIILLCKLKSDKYLVGLHAKIDFTKQGWYQNYQNTYDKVEQKNQFKEIRQQLSEKIPNTIEKILSGSVTTFTDLQDTLYFKHAQNYVQRLPKESTISDLEKSIKHNKIQAQKIITDIGADKAWEYTASKLKNRTLKTELNLWVKAVSNIGKTESKRTQKWRKIAKQQMQKCKDVIPCWIMPLQQLADTITPQQEMYDYIIVDEASQLGIDAMLLLYLTKKIIIVGDNQQTAPEYIGVKEEEVQNAIDRYLQDIPHKGYYGTTGSFFDHADAYFDKITLREHFRYMPEIIEFSNQLCYAPHTSLFPLRTYSEKRLVPLKNTFCDTGYVKGKGSGINNKSEVEVIVSKIVKIIKDDKYQNKTIDVIVLQGNAQQDIIHSLLLKKVNSKDYQERKIMVGSPASFQGDERDIIFLSLVTAHNHDRRALTTGKDKRRFNVAASRAKDQLWLFHSVRLEDLTNHNDFRYKLLDYIVNYNTTEFEQRQLISVPNPKPMYGEEPKPPQPFRSWFEVEVYNDIINRGHRVEPAHKVAGYEIDLVVFCADGTKIAIECDGDYWHGDEQYEKDMQRQEILKRAGWQFFRILYSHYINDKHQATAQLWDVFSNHSIQVETRVKKQDNIQLQEKSTQEEQIKNIESEQLSIFKQGENEATETLFFNLYQSGNYIVSKSEKEDADFSLAIDEEYQQGYLLQCYGNGHINKFDVSVLLSRQLDKEYQTKNRSITSEKLDKNNF